VFPADRDLDGEAEQGASDTHNTVDARGKRRKKKKQGKVCGTLFRSLLRMANTLYIVSYKI
jgi:hypothetical protein